MVYTVVRNKAAEHNEWQIIEKSCFGFVLCSLGFNMKFGTI